MSQVQVLEHGDAVLSADVLAHLEEQLTSVRGLLQVVLEQGAAIRERDVPAVVTLTGTLQGELARRRTIEEERTRLLERAGTRLGVDAGSVTLTLLTDLMEPRAATLAEAKSAELRGLLEVVQREHHVNRALMTQELAFLDHLLRLAGAGDAGYDAAGDRANIRPGAVRGPHRVLDVEV
ncbi:MAG TPA: flagellar export chaperone FlgN [Solirubrobacteraceae bacterium]|nr:flagellar export chaperone FlgN [Solirubrobacteraceae bacterium]